jgi:recombinational DNA repair protein (RecF pathway)
MVMDAGDASVDLMTEKFGRHAALLRRSNRFDMWILRGADHTFTPLHAQQKVISYLTKQLQQRFGDSAA